MYYYLQFPCLDVWELIRQVVGYFREFVGQFQREWSEMFGIFSLIWPHGQRVWNMEQRPYVGQPVVVRPLSRPVLSFQLKNIVIHFGIPFPGLGIVFLDSTFFWFLFFGWFFFENRLGFICLIFEAFTAGDENFFAFLH